ncbi:2295_t:CDS:1, partial [Dentiscutata erythropus]
LISKKKKKEQDIDETHIDIVIAAEQALLEYYSKLPNQNKINVDVP